MMEVIDQPCCFAYGREERHHATDCLWGWRVIALGVVCMQVLVENIQCCLHHDAKVQPCYVNFLIGLCIIMYY